MTLPTEPLALRRVAFLPDEWEEGDKRQQLDPLGAAALRGAEPDRLHVQPW
jgi:hypothetical protein